MFSNDFSQGIDWIWIGLTVGQKTHRGAVRASHLAKKSKDKTLGVFFHAAFDFDTPGPWNTAQKSKNNENTNL